MTNPNPLEQPSQSAGDPRGGPDRGHASGKSNEAETGQRCRVRVGSVDGILAVVPHLLGFKPSNSMVVLGVGGPHGRIRLAFRYDLPDPPEEELAADIAAHATTVLSRQHLTLAVAIGYGPGRTVTPVADALCTALDEARIRVKDILRVDGGRYFSYVCKDPSCCPPEGVAFDPDDHPAAAAMAAAGLTVRSDRSELTQVLAPETASAASISRAAESARLRATQMIVDGLEVSKGTDVLEPLADAGRRSVRRAVAMYRRGESLTDENEIAWLGLTLSDIRVRDDAWARMDPDFHAAHRRLWTDLVRNLPAEFIPAPASLLAFTAWQAGEGALANVAIERALDADPHYSMALLIAEAVSAGLPPSVARLPMTPKQVAATYGQQRASKATRQQPKRARSRAARRSQGGKPNPA